MPDREGSALPASGLAAAVVLILTTLWLSPGPYVSSRPTTARQGETKSHAAQDIDARLWQDPFPAAEQHREDVDKLVAGTDDAAGSKRLAAENERHDPKSVARALGSRNAVVIAVLVAGGPYAEHAEQRRRARYAVLSALNTTEFSPDDEAHIGYAQLPYAVGEGSSRMEIVPFEIFRAGPRPHWGNASERPRVAVLWLDENAFRRRPLTALDALFAELVPASGPGAPAASPSASAGEPPGLDRIVLGPLSSTVLAEMVDELDSGPHHAWAHLAGLTMYSPTATAPPAQIFRSDRSGRRRTEDDIVSRFQRRGIAFLRTSPSDDLLMAAVLQELGRRHLTTLAQSPDHIAVVAEWDTLYGRALPDAFERVLCGDARPCPSLHRFSYMRGLDGLLPTLREADRDGALKPDGKKDQPDRGGLERPDGDSQYDYVRRLAQRIHQRDQALRHERPAARIRAVGVLGSDPYDKQIVMQAVRRELPGALLFTTDLDARVLRPDEVRWSRNLLVASGFGLSLAPGLQGHVPPFRDSEQTATYLTTLVALTTTLEGNERSRARVEKAVARWKDAPRVFEVGRTRAHDLSASGPAPVCGLEAVLECPGVHPEPDDFLRRASPSLPWALPGAAVVAVGLAFVSMSRVPRAAGTLWRRARRLGRTRRTAAVALVGGVAGLAGAGVALVAAAASERGGEPLTLLEGISVWPTEALRLLAVIIAVIALTKVCCNRPLSVSLPRAFRLPRSAARPQACFRDVGSWRRLRRIFAAGPPEVAPWARIRAEDIWIEYLYQSSIPGRALRVLLSTALFFIFGSLVVRWIFTPPDAPVRGVWAGRVDTILLWMSVLAFILLIFTVADAIRLCYRAARSLARDARTQWPYATRQRFIERLVNAHRTSEATEAFFSEWIESWIDVQFVARWTTSIASLSYYPFAVLGLLLLARGPVFDDWAFTPGLLIIFALSAVYAIGAAYLLRRTAERTRTLALRAVAEAQLRASSGELWKQRLLRLVRNDIATLREGAFVPFMQQPVIKAVLVPLASILSTLIPLEYLLKAW